MFYYVKLVPCFHLIQQSLRSLASYVSNGSERFSKSSFVLMITMTISTTNCFFSSLIMRHSSVSTAVKHVTIIPIFYTQKQTDSEKIDNSKKKYTGYCWKNRYELHPISKLPYLETSILCFEQKWLIKKNMIEEKKILNRATDQQKDIYYTLCEKSYHEFFDALKYAQLGHAQYKQKKDTEGADQLAIMSIASGIKYVKKAINFLREWNLII